MGEIKLLDNLTIQKIAAGEVIENPASIVKELVENSIDAGAANITIEIAKGGKELIRITDDGIGMSEDDLKIAFKRHSTSKLNTVEDIYNIMSLGFRGEALASISSVAKLEVMTKKDNAKAGTHARVEEGEVLSLESVGTPRGTTMLVKDIFYNLPVRKKFMKSDTTEGNYINNIVTRMALGNPGVSFKFIRDGKTVLQTKRSVDLKNTIYTVLGREFAENIIPVDYEDGYLKLNGYITNNNLYRGNRGHQYFFINGRYILNFGIVKAIENRYKTLIPINRFPGFVLNLEIDPGEIDINIHPTKQEVKFTNPDRVIGSISNVVDGNLMDSLYIPRISSVEKKKEESLPNLFEDDGDKKENINKSINIKDYTDMDFSGSKGKKSVDKREDFRLETPYNPDYSKKDDKNLEDKSTIPMEEVDISEFLDDIFFDNDEEVEQIDLIKEDDAEEKIENVLMEINPIGRIFDTYIIAESKTKDKVYFIDQHAAHERIMFEKYKKEFEEESIAVQQLMLAEVIELTGDEMIKYQENKDLFKDLGFDIEEFGANSLRLRGVPMIFGNPESKKLFIEIFDNLEAGITSNYDMRIEKIMKIACVNAIKSGDNISNEEIMSLFKQLMECEKPYTCPHGRPTMIEMTKTQMEKEFLRII